MNLFFLLCVSFLVGGVGVGDFFFFFGGGGVVGMRSRFICGLPGFDVAWLLREIPEVNC